MTAQTPATAEMEEWLRVRFFTNFWLWIRFERKTQNRAGLDSGTPDPVPPLVDALNTSTALAAGEL